MMQTARDWKGHLEMPPVYVSPVSSKPKAKYRENSCP